VVQCLGCGLTARKTTHCTRATNNTLVDDEYNHQDIT
jgi:hypothetical protein